MCLPELLPSKVSRLFMLSLHAAVALSVSACSRAPAELPARGAGNMQRSTPRAITAIPAIAAVDKPRITGGPQQALSTEPSQYLVSGLTPFAANCDGGGGGGSVFASAEVEPSLAVNPLNPNTLVGVWQQDRWSNGGAHGLVSATSLDGGRSWTRTPQPFSRCGGGSVMNGGDYLRASDPWVTYAPNGVVHAMSLSISGTSFQAGSANAMLASRSFDHGRSWSSPVTLIRDGAAAFNDKNAMTADPNDANYIYAVWDRLIAANNSGPAYFARTTNGGASWETARPIHDPGAGNQTIGNQIVVLPSGALIDVFNQINRPQGGLQRSRVGVVRSLDRGQTWSGPIFIDDLLAIGTTDPESGSLIRDGSIIPEIAVSPNGDVYVVWQDSRFSGFDGIALSRSTDGGLSWSAPTRVNALASVPAFTPSVHVNADGTVGVAYYDLRNNTPAASLLTDYWLATSTDHAATWTETRISGSFDLLTAPNASGFFLGDYQGLASINGRFVSFFVKTSNGDLANRTDVYAAPTEFRVGAAGKHVTAAATRQAMQARQPPARFQITSALRLRIDSNLRRRLEQAPSPDEPLRPVPHFSLSVLAEQD